MAQSVAALPVDAKFAVSVRHSISFPLNLVHQQTFSATLRAYRKRLDIETPRLFENVASNLDVPIQDFSPASQRFDRVVVKSLNGLRQHCGLHVSPTALNHGLEFTKADPQCRAVFLHADDGRAKLKITREMILELFSFNQIMPGYLELIFLFGESMEANDLKFSAFREQTSLKPLRSGLEHLRRSGQKYELCYNIKTVSRKDLPASARLRMGPRTEWYVEQAGIFHKFDVKFGTTFWTFTSGSSDLEDRFKEVTDQNDRPEDRSFDTPVAAFRSSLAIHAAMVNSASESWRWYLQWLDEEIEKATSGLLWESREPGKSRRRYQASDLQQVQFLSDKVGDVILSLEGNMEVVKALREFYSDLLQDPDFDIRSACGDYVTMFVKQTRNANYDLGLQLFRAKALPGRVLQRKDLMLQYMNTQTAERQEELTNSAENETIMMRIITVVTLVYLPATFVSTFFSTPAITFPQATSNSGTGFSSNSSDDRNDSTTALVLWLEISIPLTIATLAAAFGVFYWERKRKVQRRQRETKEKYRP